MLEALLAFFTLRWQSLRDGSRTWIFTNVFSDTYSFTATLIDSGTIYRAIISIPESNTTLVSSIASLTVKPASIFHAIIDQTSIGNGSFTYYEEKMYIYLCQASININN
jgi:hypothetical protein